MKYLPVAIALLALVVALHSVLWSSVAGWHITTARAWRVDPAEARRRNASPPWFVRYAAWLDERIPSRAGRGHGHDPSA